MEDRREQAIVAITNSTTHGIHYPKTMRFFGRAPRGFPIWLYSTEQFIHWPGPPGAMTHTANNGTHIKKHLEEAIRNKFGR